MKFWLGKSSEKIQADYYDEPNYMSQVMAAGRRIQRSLKNQLDALEHQRQLRIKKAMEVPSNEGSGNDGHDAHNPLASNSKERVS